jgi:hypothetical protein
MSVTLSRSSIEAMAPDQGALKAAAGLLKPAKWSARGRSGPLIWGECQGSGANPYRVCADTADVGSKCTCPSRKFPCKHGLALMWLYVDEPGAFGEGAVPAWVSEWTGRRRKGGGTAVAPSAGKSLEAAAETAEPAAADQAVEARRQAAGEKRSVSTQSQVSTGLDELELWIADVLRTGLGGFLGEVSERCRRIAARLVDAKAAALASRIDEAPSRLLALPTEERADAAICELGRIVLLIQAWRASPDDPELRREVVATETREEVLANPAATRTTSTWEVLGERIETRRDRLVSVATWLINLQDHGPRFALLQDYFPASAGWRSGAFVAGQRFSAQLSFYPARSPLRAIIAERKEAAEAGAIWLPASELDPLAAWKEAQLAAPWSLGGPILLPPGRIAEDGTGRAWWIGEAATLPVQGSMPGLALGADVVAAAGLWNGTRLSLLAARTDWGRLGFDA